MQMLIFLFWLAWSSGLKVLKTHESNIDHKKTMAMQSKKEPINQKKNFLFVIRAKIISWLYYQI